MMFDQILAFFKKSEPRPEVAPLQLTQGGTAPLVWIAAKDARAEWERRVRLAGTTGQYPVVLGGPEVIAQMREYESIFEATFADTMAAAAGIVPEAWFAERRAEDPEAYSNEEAPWPAEVPDVPMDSLVLNPPFGKRHSEVLMALFPTAHGWEVPALLGWGGWNDCPMPEVHVALLRRWHALYGAELFTIGWDTLEMRVGRPPGDREGALALADEQYLYCGDIVWQGVGNVTELAAGLVNQPLWYFWWD